MQQKTCHKFTVMELLVASTVLIVILAALMPLAMFVATGYLKVRTMSDLNAQALIAQERIKQDLTGTARSEIIMYPSGATSAKATSFPVLRRDPSSTSAPLDANGNIQWNQTVIYHMYYNSATQRNELRRTVFNPRDNTLTALQRLYQLVYTWLYGEGRYGIYNTQNATTETLLDNVLSYRISSGRAEVDGYSSTHVREVNPLGTWVLYTGYQYFLFRVTGKNSSSSGYKMGLDNITVSATGDSYDLEYFLPPHATYGPTAVSENMSAFSGWTNNAQLYFPATGAGQYVYFRIHNDMWLETMFNHETAVMENTELTFDPAIGENICQMIGNRNNWLATVQSLGAPPTPDTFSYTNGTVRVALKSQDTTLGHTIAFPGARGRVTFTADPSSAKKLTIVKAYIMERDSGYNGVPGTEHQLFFADAAAGTDPGISVYNSNQSVKIIGQSKVTSDLFDLAIDPNKEYLVSYYIGATAGEGAPTVWEDATGSVHSYYVGSGDYSGTADWSGLASGSVTDLAKIVGVESVYCTYPETATYTSRIQDTRLANPAFMSANWRETHSATCSMKLRVRAGDLPDLADAPAWSSALEFTDPAGTNSLTGLPTGRYIQWQAVFNTIAPNTQTAKLRDVSVLWPGERRGVDVTVALEKNADMGMFELYVNGYPPSPAALNMAFVLRQDVRGQPFERQLVVEAAPRNE